MKTSVKLLVGVSSFALSNGAISLEFIDTAKASVTVANSFILSKGATELNFGTIRAVNEDSQTASVVLDPSTGTKGTPTSTGGNALIQNLASGTAAVFEITNAAPSTPLTISLPSTDITLSPTTTSGGPSFTVGTFVAYLPSTGSTYVTDGDLQTDSSGAATFRVGATLTTDSSTSTTAYESDDYEGFYRVEVQY